MASTALLAEDLNTLPMEPVCVLLFGVAGKKSWVGKHKGSEYCVKYWRIVVVLSIEYC